MWNIILEPQSERHQGWQAFLHGSPTSTKGVGRTKEEAVGALWNQVVGKLILENPVPFGVTLTIFEQAMSGTVCLGESNATTMN